MKAMICTRYGPPEVFEYRDVPLPSPKDNEVRIRIHATTVSAGDCEIRRFHIQALFWLPLRLALGIRQPKKKILGTEFSGVIDAVGSATRKFKVGDPVFGVTHFKFGTYAEYVTLKESAVIEHKPQNINFSEAAGVHTGGLNGLHFMRLASIKPGQEVLIYGASGSIGTAAIQIASYYGAKVTAICSPYNFEMVKSIGAKDVIDYHTVDFTKEGKMYDVIFDAIGKGPYLPSIKCVKKSGYYIQANPSPFQMFASPLLKLLSGKKVTTKMAPESREDLLFLKKLIEEKHFKTVIDREFPLESLVEAHTYVEKGHKSGNVIITVFDEAE